MYTKTWRLSVIWLQLPVPVACKTGILYVADGDKMATGLHVRTSAMNIDKCLLLIIYVKISILCVSPIVTYHSDLFIGNTCISLKVLFM